MEIGISGVGHSVDPCVKTCRPFFPLVYDGIDETIHAVKSKQVDGMLLDRYAASYYQGMDKLKSLVTVKKFDFQRDVGVLIAKDISPLATCLDFFRADILKVVQTVTDTLKVSFNYLCNTGSSYQRPGSPLSNYR